MHEMNVKFYYGGMIVNSHFLMEIVIDVVLLMDRERQRRDRINKN